MNKTSLLLVALALGAQSVHGYTNKTYLQPRNQGLVNLPMEMTTYQERLGHRCQTKHGFGGFGEDTFFYGQNTNKHAVGRYFGAHTNHMNVVQAGLVEDDASVENITPGTLDIGYIIHNRAMAAARDENVLPTTSIKLNPESTHYGFDFVYYQDLSKALKGVYFKINCPIVYIENNLSIKVTQTSDSFDHEGDLATKENIYRYFAGETILGQTVIDRQAPLTAGKINGEHSATGLADVDMVLGYNFLNNNKYHVDVNVALSLPVGNKPTGEYLFEPVYGTRHVGIGGGIDADARIWGTDCHHIKVNFKANYRYMIQATEKRMLSLNHKQWGQYVLLASADPDTTVLGNNQEDETNRSFLTPAANILNQYCDVTPGSQFDAMLGFSYKRCGLSLDLGYNFYARERERVKSQQLIPGKTYVVAARGLDITTNIVAGEAGDSSSEPFADNAAIADGNTVINGSATPMVASDYISHEDIDANAAATPAQITNSIYAGAGYLFKAYGYPVFLGIGGKYEFAANNNVLEVWQAWGKVGINF